MVATGWVCSEHMTEERVHFSGERERVPRGRSIQERVKSALRETFQGGVLVFILGLLGTSQWLS